MHVALTPTSSSEHRLGQGNSVVWTLSANASQQSIYDLHRAMSCLAEPPGKIFGVLACKPQGSC